MLFLLCACKTALAVTGDSDEVHLLLGDASDFRTEGYTCPTCSGEMLPRTLCDLEGFTVHHLTPTEAFAALKGVGLPEEKQCDEATVRQLLLGSKIVSITARALPGTTRTVLHDLMLESGHRVFLGCSPAGAIVYRITGKGPA